MIENKNNVYQRLIRHMAINKTSGCWEWVGSKRNGYGRIIVGSRTDGTRRSMSAHRVSYELKYGEIPEGMEVCHKCDNPCCVNPDHLFLGTRQDNIDDRERKGRNVTFTGEEQPRSKLTKKAVKDARWERACVMADREKLIDLLMDKPFGNSTEEREIAHAEDVAEYLISNGVTVRERGRWETTEVTEEWETVERYSHFHRECKYSYCDNGLGGHYFCPNCGADMRGEEDGNET